MTTIEFENENVKILKHIISEKTIYETKLKVLDNFNIDHGYFSSFDIDFSLAKYDKKVFEKYMGKNLDDLNLIKIVHSDKIIEAKKRENQDIDKRPEVDGIWTNTNIPLITTSADCISYIVFDKKRNILFNIHSGWMRVANRIVIKAVNMLLENGNKEDIFVFSFPNIKKCHFVVKDDVLEIFNKLFSNIKEKYNLNVDKQKYISNYTIDLVGLNELELNAMGIKTFDSGICNYDFNCFNSNRKKDEYRNALYVRLK